MCVRAVKERGGGGDTYRRGEEVGNLKCNGNGGGNGGGGDGGSCLCVGG